MKKKESQIYIWTPSKSVNRYYSQRSKLHDYIIEQKQYHFWSILNIYIASAFSSFKSLRLLHKQSMLLRVVVFLLKQNKKFTLFLILLIKLTNLPKKTENKTRPGKEHKKETNKKNFRFRFLVIIEKKEKFYFNRQNNNNKNNQELTVKMH